MVVNASDVCLKHSFEMSQSDNISKDLNPKQVIFITPKIGNEKVCEQIVYIRISNQCFFEIWEGTCPRSIPFLFCNWTVFKSLFQPDKFLIDVGTWLGIEYDNLPEGAGHDYGQGNICWLTCTIYFKTGIEQK